MNLLRRVKAEPPTCQLIVLVREIQAVVQEVMQAFADAVIFKSSPGIGKGDVVQVHQAWRDQAGGHGHVVPVQPWLNSADLHA